MAGKKSPQVKKYCFKGHERHNVMVLRGGRKRFEYQCECSGYVPMKDKK